MSTKLTIREKEHKKILLDFHYAFVSVINQFTEEELKKYGLVSNMSRGFSENLLYDYENFKKMCSQVQNSDIKHISVFDKAICIALSINQCRPIMFRNINSKSPLKAKFLKEKLIAETMLAFIESSSYRLSNSSKENILDGCFNFDGYNNGHKTELNKLKKNLILILSQQPFDYFGCLNILKTIYVRGILYKEGLAELDEKQLMNSLAISETFEYKSNSEQLRSDYNNYIKSKRM